jgi:DNA-binding response OmpR family regulator
MALRVLLVEDSESVRLTMEAVLELEGHVVASASSLVEARQLHSTGRFDLVLLDVHLGDGLGTELIPELRQLQPQAVVAILSGHIDDAGGADLVLDKGQDPGELVRTLERAAAARAS